MPLNPGVPSQAEAEAARINALISSLLDVRFGTLWWLREDLWKACFAAEGIRYDEQSKRMAHPGVSLRTTPVSGLGQWVPMLHGSSGRRHRSGSFEVTGLTPDSDRPKTTFFRLGPVPVKTDEWVIRVRKTAGKGEEARARPNFFKPRLSDAEAVALFEWASARGML